MLIKRYEAPTMSEALQKVKDELGADAIILEARTVKPRGVLARFRPPVVEVTAAQGSGLLPEKDERSASQPPAGRSADLPASQPSARPFAEMSAHTEPVAPEGLRPWPAAARTGAAPFRERMSMEDIYFRLAALDVSEAAVTEVMDRLSSAPGGRVLRGDVNARVIDAIADYIHTSGPLKLVKGRCKVVAFVGPTGVGKTTTIAKIAAHHSLIENAKVALVTQDTYRIAAVEQIKTYGDIMGIPVDVAYSPAEMESIIESHRDKDLVLVDTTGRSPKNTKMLYELRRVLDAAQPEETHLVLAANVRLFDALDIVDRYRVVGFDKLIFTKLDETNMLGGILSVIQRSGCPVSYVTTGQNVPEDIEVCDSRRLAELIWNPAR